MEWQRTLCCRLVALGSRSQAAESQFLAWAAAPWLVLLLMSREAAFPTPKPQRHSTPFSDEHHSFPICQTLIGPGLTRKLQRSTSHMPGAYHGHFTEAGGRGQGFKAHQLV